MAHYFNGSPRPPSMISGFVRPVGMWTMRYAHRVAPPFHSSPTYPRAQQQKDFFLNFLEGSADRFAFLRSLERR